MDSFVIFQNKPIIWIILSVIVIMYVIDAALGIVGKRMRATIKGIEENGEENVIDKREYYLSLINISRLNICSAIVAVVNLLLHVGEFVCLLFIKATLAEIMFLLMISIALALTVNNIKGEDEENGI